MSLAENLLNGLTETTNQSTSPVNDILAIDAETRTILVPDTETLFGVVTDGNSERKYFKCPRIVGDNIDLTTLNLRVNYRNALGEDDGYIVTDVKVSGDFITFSWKLEGNLFKAKGPIYFAVCAVEVDDNGTETCAWNTTLATGEVLDGFRVILTETEEEHARDILQQLLNLLQTRSNEAVQAVTDEGTKQVANVESVGATQRALIESKGAETLATIPEDYTTTYNNADESLRKKAKAILLEGTGEVISVDDASGDYVRGLKVFGKSEQVTTTGKNLFPVTERSIDGVTLSRVDDYYVLNGTATTSGIIRSSIGRLESGTYTLSSNNPTNNGIEQAIIQVYSPTMPNWLTCLDIKNNAVITGKLDAADNYESRIRYEKGITYDNYIIKPQIELGDVATEYEPYTGGKPAPNPEYPQEIVNLDTPMLKVCGKNLFDGVIGNYAVSENTISISSAYVGFVCPVIGGLTYTVSRNVVSSDRFRIVFIDSEPTNKLAYIDRPYIKDDALFITATAPKNAKYLVCYLSVSKEDVSKTNYQVEIGDTITDYEPYKPAQTITIPRSLPGIPVSSGGNYTDSDGQQWICDEVDFERGVYVQRVLKEIISGTPNFEETEDCPGRYLWQSALSKCYSAGRVFAFSNFASWTTWAEGTAGKDWFAIDRYKLYYKPAETTTASEVNTLFTEMITSDTAPVILAVLDTPIETPLTADELDTFRTLHTNYPNTTVLNDSGATMQLLYNADTKGYIEKNYVSRSEYNDLVDRITALENN